MGDICPFYTFIIFRKNILFLRITTHRNVKKTLKNKWGAISMMIKKTPMKIYFRERNKNLFRQY
jgi:hypothetical protein